MIDYGNIALSQKWYSAYGYKQIEVPWLVSEAINKITCPPNVLMYNVTKGDKKKTLVASGEQGFLYLIAKSQLPPGFYQTVTPCFRNDDFDQWHTKYFIKNELIVFGTSNYNMVLYGMLGVAENLLVDLGLERKYLERAETDTGIDLLYRNIEVGSYGIRETSFVKWVYGTGLAEPRFSMVKKAFVK